MHIVMQQFVEKNSDKIYLLYMSVFDSSNCEDHSYY